MRLRSRARLHIRRINWLPPPIAHGLLKFPISIWVIPPPLICGVGVEEFSLEEFSVRGILCWEFSVLEEFSLSLEGEGEFSRARNSSIRNSNILYLYLKVLAIHVIHSLHPSPSDDHRHSAVPNTPRPWNEQM